MPVLTPVSLGLQSSTGVYKIALANAGVGSIQSITIADDGIVSGAPGKFSGLDLDFVALAYEISN